MYYLLFMIHTNESMMLNVVQLHVYVDYRLHVNVLNAAYRIAYAS